MIDIEVEALLTNLRKLYSKRIKLEKDDIFSYEEDDDIYSKAMSMVCKKLEQLFKDEKIDYSELITGEEWQKYFTDNFYKKFIDRDSCKTEDVNNSPHLQFNEGVLENEDQGNLCYAESFAVAFLVMLSDVSEVEKINGDYLFDLFNKFHKIVTCNDLDAEIDKASIRASGGYLCDDDIIIIDNVEQFGVRRSLYNPGTAYMENFFGKEFKHEELMRKFLADFATQLPELSKKEPEIILKEICKLLKSIEYQTHLFEDGNGRAASLLGDYLAIKMTGSFLPRLISSHVTTESIKEGMEWNDNFMKKSTEIKSFDGGENLSIKRIESYASENPINRFIYDLLRERNDDPEELLFDLKQFDLSKDLYLTKYSSTYGGMVISNDYKQGSEVFKFDKIVTVLENNGYEGVLSKTDLDDRMIEIATLYMQYIKDNKETIDLQQEDFNVLGRIVDLLERFCNEEKNQNLIELLAYINDVYDVEMNPDEEYNGDISEEYYSSSEPSPPSNTPVDTTITGSGSIENVRS